MKKLFGGFLLLLIQFSVYAQQSDSLTIRNIFSEALTNGKSYSTLDHLCNRIGNRLSGSPAAQKAVEYTAQQMYAFNFDTVYLQGVMVPHWVRGKKEQGYFMKDGKKNQVHICALGNSIGTPDSGIRASVIEVHQLKDLEKLGREKISGKIVFYNRPLDPTYFNTGRAYGEAGDQRGSGAIEAAKFGAVGVIVRSLTLAHDTNPHTGMMRYDDSITRIPGCAISTVDADMLSEALRKGEIVFYFKQHCKMLEDVLSYNVIGEIRGKEKPEEVLVVGGHLDSWDVGQGAHDDGAGVVQSMEALRIIKALKLKPKRTIRCVLFMNEENGVRGGNLFADFAAFKPERIIAAVESDGGAGTPRGFGVEDSLALKHMEPWQPLLSAYGVDYIRKGWGGTDINPLKKYNTVLIGLLTDNQRYFDYHHTAIDTFDKIHKRELELGAGCMSSLLWLMSEYGVR